MEENCGQIFGILWDQEAGEKLLGATRDTETTVQQEGWRWPQHWRRISWQRGANWPGQQVLQNADRAYRYSVSVIDWLIDIL